ncbi:MAG TPA: PIN domain-containing protein [Kofleriaceae bacterium]|nr:PIN domain-containing protein [Kofleriaceae bacterium]
MTVAADTSVLVAAFASWHERHDVALAAIRRLDAVVAHCLLETYSVLTRLPAPHRMTADVVSRYLQASFGERRVLGLTPQDQRKLVASLATWGVTGGAVYDALIAAVCRNARATLLTLDGRAHQTYAMLGVSHELLG